MDIISSIIGLVVGTIIAYVIFYLLNKTKSVSKIEFEILRTSFNEVNSNLKVTQDRLQNLQDYSKQIEIKLQTKESDILNLQSKTSSYETSIEVYKNNIEEFTVNILDEKQTNQSLQDEINKLKQYISKLEAGNESLNDKLTTQKSEIVEIQKMAHLQFEKIANQIFEDKSGKFTETNKTNIEAILKPLGEGIENFKRKVEETYDKESKQRFSLEDKVKELIEQTNKISSEANNLATALKGQSKKQGSWGEMILESVLEKSGLIKDREYFTQQTIKDDEGKSLRPDILVKLPDNRVIIIDSKVSIVAYDKFTSSENIDEQKMFLAEHIKSINGHIDDLSSKKYDNLESSLDFTMMFVPIEPAYMIAMQADQELWAYAYSKRILLISPTNLIACLKLISDLWKREMQSKNAMEIVKRGELLYEKFVNFTKTLEDLGRNIDKTQKNYNDAIGQLNTGSGHLVGQALKLKNLGLKSDKKIPENLISFDIELDETTEIKLLSEENNVRE